MKILINNYINLIKAFTSDGVKKLDSFDDLKQFYDEELDINFGGELWNLQ